MEIHVKRNRFDLTPCDQESLAHIKKMRKDKTYKINITEARNYEFLKKFMALVKVGCENSKTITAPFDVYRKYIIIKAGYYKLYTTPKGSFIEADSISFGSMSEDKFQEVYKAVLDQIILDIDSTKEEIESIIINFL